MQPRLYRGFLRIKRRNSNIQFHGYKFENGRIVIHDAEAKIVNQVFTDYIKGSSYLKISNLLIQKEIEFLPNQVNWNKNKVKRIIEDKRYLGDDKYPKIIETDLFIQANSTKAERDTTKNVKRTSYIYKLNMDE